MIWGFDYSCLNFIQLKIIARSTQTTELIMTDSDMIDIQI